MDPVGLGLGVAALLGPAFAKCIQCEGVHDHH